MAASWARDRHTSFYFGSAIAGLLITLVGFHLTYTQPVVTGTYTGPWWGHLHGAVAMAWLFLIIAQTWLAPRNIRLHRTLGAFAILVIPLWFATTVMIAREFAQITTAGGELERAQDNILGALVSPLVVAIVAGLALHYRKRPQAHKRLVFIATVVMLWPSWARWRHYFPDPDAVDQLFSFFIALTPIPLAMLRDKLKFGAVHPALLWGGVAVLAEQTMEVLAHGSPAWNAVSHALYRLLV